MKNQLTSITLELLEKLFDRKLQPIKEEIAVNKDILENRVYKEMREMKAEMREGFNRPEEINGGMFDDHVKLELRVRSVLA